MPHAIDTVNRFMEQVVLVASDQAIASRSAEVNSDNGCCPHG